jgi:hypothetical protein
LAYFSPYLAITILLIDENIVIIIFFVDENNIHHTSIADISFMTR